MSPPRAVGLLSGGLDSTLATAMLRAQGVEVLGINFSTGFCLTDHRRALRRDEGSKRVRNEALRLGADLRVPVEILDICNRDYLQVLTKPKYGYGSAANPCVDCRTFMFRGAREYMEEHGADFVFSGEVLGQRPMSQQRKQLDIIAKESGLGDRLLRPLSARRLPPTLPEREGWVDRERLGDLHGRSRKAQLELAAEYGLDDFPQPAGGCCYLTDQAFADRFRDFLRHAGPDYEPDYHDFLLLKVGRHFRLPTGTKVITGRDDAENRFLERWRDDHWVFRVEEGNGAVVLTEAPFPMEDVPVVAGLAVRYSGSRDGDAVPVRYGPGTDPSSVLTAHAPAEPLVETWRI